MRWKMMGPAIAIASAVVACDRTPFEGDPVGEYELLSIDGDPLPAAFIVNQAAQPQVVLLESRLVLRSNGRGDESSRQSYPQSPGAEVNDIDSEFEYRIDGDEIRITYDCPPFASCIAGPHLVGQITETGIVFGTALGRTPLVYRRL